MKKILFALLAILLLIFLMVFTNNSSIDSQEIQNEAEEVKRSVELFFNNEYNSLLQGKFPSDVSSTDQGLVEEIRNDLQGSLNSAKKNNINYSRVDIDYNYFEILIDGKKANVKLELHIDVYYNLPNSQTSKTGFYRAHNLELEKSNGTWFIISSKYLDTANTKMS